MTRNRLRVELAVALLIALACRLVWWKLNVSIIENEGAEYARMGQNILAGKGFVGLFGGRNFLFPPLYPSLIAAGAAIFGSAETAGRVVSLLAGLGLVVVVYLIAREIFDERVARIAGLFAAMHPVLVALSVSVYSESLAIFLTALGAYLAISSFPAFSARRAAAAGLAFGAGYWIKPENLVSAACVSGALVLFAFLKQRRPAAALRYGVLPLITALALAAPYMAYLTNTAGRFTWEGKSAVIDVLNARMWSGLTYPQAARGIGARVEPEAPYLEGPFLTADHVQFLRNVERPVGNKMKDMLTAAPKRARLIVYNLLYAEAIGAPWILLLAFIGFVASGWWRRSLLGGVIIVGLATLQIAVLLALAYSEPRYFLPAVAFIIPWASAGIDELVRAGERLLRGITPSFNATRVGTAVAYVIVLVFVLRTYPAVVNLGEFAQSHDAFVRVVASKLRPAGVSVDSAERQTMMGFSSTFAFYSGATLAYLPDADEARSLQYVHLRSPTYIVLRSTESRQAPYVETWLARGIPDACAVPTEAERGPGGQHIRIWRWNCTRSSP